MSKSSADLIAKLAARYYDKAQAAHKFCTASLDEVRIAYMGVAELEKQGLADEPSVYEVIRSALVKDPDCVEPFEQAWREVVGGK